jgi:hypothetical protein
VSYRCAGNGWVFSKDRYILPFRILKNFGRELALNEESIPSVPVASEPGGLCNAFMLGQDAADATVNSSRFVDCADSVL